MTQSPAGRSLLLSLHHFSWRMVDAMDDVGRGLWAGLWLGILDRQQIHRVDKVSYAASTSYPTAEHNLSGLFGWECEAIDRSFRKCRTLVLLGAGAGREVVPLLEQGFKVDAYECHDDLRRAGNHILASRKASCSIESMERDCCPDLHDTYDGVIIGWGMLTLVQGRSTRLRLLRDLRSAVPAGAPMLLSFFMLGGPKRRYRIAHRLGNFIRSLLGREKLDFGDFLTPGYAHFFSRESLEDELQNAGWCLESLNRRTYPHAIATAVDGGV